MEDIKKISEFPTAISWENITFGAGDREILRGLTGTARPGRLLAMIGVSGAGKTTLLKLIADRLSKEGDRRAGGNLYVNACDFTPKHRSLMSFVPQDDILNGLSSASETLQFAARMRRGNLPTEVTDQMVEDALVELGLDHVRDTVIGIPGLTSGLSGGERKRANIGAEFVHRPKVLLLDEPTTGLDTVTSERICRILKNLALKGHTVICTIHQPTFDCIAHFDDLMILARGRTVYHGPMDEAVPYFARNGFQCPRDSTPIDYFMWHLEDEKDCPKMLEAWDNHIAALEKEHGANRDNYPPCLAVPYKAGPSQQETIAFLDEHFLNTDVPFSVQLSELFKRAFLNAMRNRMNIIATLMQAVLFGAFTGILFHDLTDDVAGVADRFGVIFTMAVNCGFSGASAVINTFPAIKAVFLREQQAGSYSVLAFYVATFLADLPLQLIAMCIQVIIVYFATGLAVDAGRFFIFLAVMILTQQVSVSIGLALSAGTSNPIIASALIPTIMTPMMLTGGFLASTDRLRPYWVWLERVSFIRMPFVIMSHNEFYAIDSLACDVAKYGASFCDAQPKNGVAVMQNYGLDSDLDANWIAWLTLTAILLFCRFLGWFALYRTAGQKE